MKILALDTSCMSGSVALVDGSNVIAEQTLNIQVTHSERLIPSIDFVLTSAGLGLSDVDAFAVAIGPGSFTGLRIGLAVAKAFAFTKCKPIVGVSSLKALAYNMYGSSCLVASLIDARRGEYYAGINKFEGKKLVTVLEDSLMPPDQLTHRLASFDSITVVGDGVSRLRASIEKLSSVTIPLPAQIGSRASNIAWLAAGRLANDDSDDAATLVPNYIRKSDAEIGKR